MEWQSIFKNKAINRIKHFLKKGERSPYFKEKDSASWGKQSKTNKVLTRGTAQKESSTVSMIWSC